MVFQRPRSMDRSRRLSLLESRLGYRWQEPQLLLQALRHASAVSDRLVSNERLEFLGDSVLGVVVGMYLMRTHPFRDEGFLSITRAGMTNQAALAIRGRELELDKLIEIPHRSEYLRGEDRVVADCFEAVVGSVFIDSGDSLIAAHRAILNSGMFR